MQGYISNLVEAKNFGFIKVDKIEYFFHRSDLLQLTQWEEMTERWRDAKRGKPGERIPIDFDVVEPEPRQGPRAWHVKIIRNGS